MTNVVKVQVSLMLKEKKKIRCDEVELNSES